MAENVTKTRGPLKSGSPKAGGGVTYDHPVIGIVKDNIDPTRSGRIRVQIEGATNNQSNEGGQWVSVQYLSTYFGMVKPTAGQSGEGDYVGNPSAYGQWQSPPDIGTKVLCIFAEGDPNRGFYVGCVIEPEALQMIPAIGSSDTVVANEGEAVGLAGAPRLPVTSINTNNKSIADSNNYLDAAKPVHSYTASIMSQQGIIRDPIRGPISSSASREAVSRVGWGVATPGRPIMEGGYDDANLPENLDAKNTAQLQVTARRGGHSIVMDDGDMIGRDQLIRIRTALGHQIMMSDDGQTLMILHSNGQSYIELGKEGTVDIFSTNSFNVRTQGDINFHADQHINFHASENMNIQAKNLHINTEEDFKMRSGKNLQLYSVEDFTVRSLGAAAIKSDGQASLASSSLTFINGLKVNLNTGKSSVKPKKVPIITLITQADTLHDEQKGFIAAPGKLLTVTSRTPAHYPWSAAGQGVDVKSTLDATKALPVTPSSAVQKANEEGLASGAQAPQIATVASAPDTKPISKSVDKTVTNAVMGSVATSAATGEVKKAVTSGAAIVKTGTSSSSASASTTVTTSGNTTTIETNVSSSSSKTVSTKVVAVGTYAQSPTQLVNANILKPGADKLVNGLAQKPNATVDKILPDNLFTGKPGAKNLQTFVADTSSQTKAVITTAQKSQTVLGKVGVMTGKETPTQSAGLVTAASTVGTKATVEAVKSVAGVAPKGADTALATVKDPLAGLQGVAGVGKSKIPGLPSATTGSLGAATKAIAAIGAGAAAAGLANTLGGLGGISKAVNGLNKGLGAIKSLGGLKSKLGGLFGGGGGDGPSFTDLVESVKGPAAAAFTTIRDSFKPLQPGVPQNLSQISKSAAAAVAGISSAASGVTGAFKELENFADEMNVLSARDIDDFIENNTIAGITGAFKQVKTQLGTIGNDLATAATGVNNAIDTIGSTNTNTTQGISNQLTAQFGGNAVATVTSLTKSLTNTPKLINGLTDVATAINTPINQVNNIFNDINTDITGAPNAIKLVPTSFENAVNEINGAVQDMNGILGAAQALVNGDKKELSSAAAAVASGASAAKSSLIASGINNLPGGAKAVGAVLNRAEGALNKLPGTEVLGDLARNVQSAAAVGQNVLNVADKINSKLGGALGKSGGLTKLISGALPIGKAAGLLSALSALGSGGPAKVKLPTISFNTFDRDTLDTQVKTLLENIKIPIPNLLGEIKAEVINQVEQLTQKSKDAFKIFDEIEKWDIKIKAAKDALYKAEADLPAGDKGIKAAQGILNSLLNDTEYVTLKKKARDFGNQQLAEVGDLITGAGETAANMLNVGNLGKAVSTIKSSAIEVINQAPSVKTSVGSVKGQGSSAIQKMQSKSLVSDAEINNSIAGIIGGISKPNITASKSNPPGGPLTSI